LQFPKNINNCGHGVGPQQHIEKLRKEVEKHQYFGLNRPIFMQKLADYIVPFYTSHFWIDSLNTAVLGGKPVD